MSYTPNRIITVSKDRLQESFDLTQPLSSFIGKDAYLVVRETLTYHVLPIGRLMTVIPKLVMTTPIKDAFTALFDDMFIKRYEVFNIPIQDDNGMYLKNMKVFNPIAYKDYKVHFTSVNTPEIIDDITRKGFLDDLVIVSDQDMTHCLVAVNGVFHQTRYLNGRLYVIDGFRTIRLTGRKDVVVVDTKELGGHTIIPLTSTNVKPSAYQQSTVITTQQSILRKSIFAVIDGYFYHRDQNVISVIDNKHLSLKVNKMPLIQQFRHNPRTLKKPDRFGSEVNQSSRQYIDPYETVFLNKRQTDSAALKTAEFQYSRLTSYHSFLVVMNNPDLFTLSMDITPTGTPQLYSEPSIYPVSGMMSYGCGLCPSYLVWRDPSLRKIILLSEQDYDVDWQDTSLPLSTIPALVRDPIHGADINARFIDYVAA
jgi:hypothetical protein